MKHDEFGWKTQDGLQLYAQAWQPEGSPKAVLCLVHGLGEHSERYAHVAQYLSERGLALLAFDLRGHGKSQGQRGHAPTYEAFLDDIAQLLDEANARFPARPRFLYGHSLGGNLVLNAILRRQLPVNGAIVTGPLLCPAFDPPGWKLALGKLMSAVWPAFSMANGLERAALSRDPAVVRAYGEDPLVHDRVSARLGIAMLQAGMWAREHAAELLCPLLLMHGDADRICSAEASQAFAARAGSACTLKLWPGFYHEIHNDPWWEDVLAYMVAWIERNLQSR